MNTKVNAQTILIVLMVFVTVLISTNTYANAQMVRDTNPFENAASDEGSISAVPVPGGPGFIMVSPVAFRPFDPSTPWAYSGMSLYNPSATLSSTTVAGLTLPHGAKITKMTLFFLDNFSEGDCTLNLFGKNVDGAVMFMGSFASNGALPEFRYVSTTDFYKPIVDNQSFSYFLYLVIPVNASTNIKITDVRIDYEYTTSLPVVMN